MIGFCFSGEGARGGIQAGIALALHKQGIDADLAMGISSGTGCAAVYSYNGPEGLAAMCRNIHSILDVFGINWNFAWNRGIFNQKPIEKVLNKLDNTQFCEGRVARMAVCTGELQWVSNKETSKADFIDATLGGIAVPGMVTDRNGWIDAGVGCMTPLKQCIEAGCDEIYVILGRLLAVPPFELPGGLFPEMWMAWRANDLCLYEILNRDIRTCLRKNTDPDFKNIKIRVCEPNELLYSSVLFRYCPRGVEYGLTEFVIHEEQALRMALL